MTSPLSTSLPTISSGTHSSLPGSPRLAHTHNPGASGGSATTGQGTNSAPTTLRAVRGPNQPSQAHVAAPVVPEPLSAERVAEMGAASSRNRYAITCEEMSKNVANRIYYSTAYQVLYISMITINLAIITWTIVQWDSYPDHTLFFVMEIIINVVFITEIIIRIIALRRAFWTQWSNWFDVIVAVLSIVILVVFHKHGYEDVIEVALLITRYLVQFLRLFIFIKNHRMNRQAASDEQRIDFNTLSENDLRLDLYDDIGIPHAPSAAGGTGWNPLLPPGTTLSDNVNPASPGLRPAAALGGLAAGGAPGAGPSPFVLEK